MGRKVSSRGASNLHYRTEGASVSRESGQSGRQRGHRVTPATFLRASGRVPCAPPSIPPAPGCGKDGVKGASQIIVMASESQTSIQYSSRRSKARWKYA